MIGLVQRPRLLDLFSGAGGCSVGFDRAGFEVIGIDKDPHPDYPFEFIQADATELKFDRLQKCWHLGRRCLGRFEVVAASPPCPAYSTITPNTSRDSHPRLIEPMQKLLRAWGGSYVIENVEGARKFMVEPAKVCGSAFGLAVRRHRYFESNLELASTICDHKTQGRPIGVYGDHPQDDEHYRRPDGTRRGNKAKTVAQAAESLGIDWMSNWDDLTDAIPPAYTEFIGRQMLSQIAEAAA